MIKLIFKLHPENNLTTLNYKTIQGYFFRAILMKWLGEIRPEIVENLHKTNENRLYSINFFINHKIPEIDFILVSFDSEINESILKNFVLKDNTKIKIGNENYFISRIQFERINFLKIYKNSKPIISFILKFFTPVAFTTSLGDYHIRFPIPALLFGNLTNLWNAINGKIETIKRDIFLNWINAHVRISYYRMKTKKINIGKKKPIIGGIGNVSYNVIKPNMFYYGKLLKEIDIIDDSNNFILSNYIKNCKWLEILCKFGEYSNTGVNRTAGMGVFRYFEKKYF